MLLRYLYQLPQNLVGLLVKLCTRARKVGDHYEYDLPLGSVSLGDYVFLCPSHWDNPTVLSHEYGHQKQSQMLGWLYLFVIGIPSFIWAGIHQCFRKSLKKHNITYYWFYTEKWADKLGGVKR